MWWQLIVFAASILTVGTCALPGDGITKTSTAGYVRCSCNLPQCVVTGYMCKSALGGCFSELSTPHNFSIPPHISYRHGCLEMIMIDDHTRRENVCIQSLNNNLSVSCCYTDMCNHLSSSLVKNYSIDGDQQLDDNDIDAQIWLRTATIVVPICGAAILLLLILVALHILRREDVHTTHEKLTPTVFFDGSTAVYKSLTEKHLMEQDIYRMYLNPQRAYHEVSIKWEACSDIVTSV